MAEKKLKTLLVFKYLDEFSDEAHPLSTSQLIEMLANDGITCDRKSIYADVKTLKEVQMAQLELEKYKTEKQENASVRRVS